MNTKCKDNPRIGNWIDGDFGTICICAVRYSLGRQTYMPKLVIDYIKSHIAEIDDRAIGVMVRDIEEAESYKWERALGDPIIDRPEWIAFKIFLQNEIKKRSEWNDS